MSLITKSVPVVCIKSVPLYIVNFPCKKQGILVIEWHLYTATPCVVNLGGTRIMDGTRWNLGASGGGKDRFLFFRCGGRVWASGAKRLLAVRCFLLTIL